jgi:DNA invertase Pin-like site-specific DNA recombinase
MMTPPTNKSPGDGPRAMAHFRHSLEDHQEDSLPIQRDQVREWAERNGVEIIQEFADAGKSGLTSEDRPAFAQMIDEWVKRRADFTYILCLDASRWGRSVSAASLAECEPRGKQLIFTAISTPVEGTHP